MNRITSAILLLFAHGCARPTECNNEAAGQVAYYGVDYAVARADAYRTLKGLRGFFLLSACTDAAGSEGYCDDLEKLLEYHGDALFAKAVTSTTSAVRERIVGNLAYVAGYGESDAVWRKFKFRFPEISGLIATE